MEAQDRDPAHKVHHPAETRWKEVAKLADPMPDVESPELCGQTETGASGRTTEAGRSADRASDVRYRLWAEISPGQDQRQSALPLRSNGCGGSRVEVLQPYFGCRSFQRTSAAQAAATRGLSQDLACSMTSLTSRAPERARTPRASAFRAQVRAGVVSVPRYSSEEVIKPPILGGP